MTRRAGRPAWNLAITLATANLTTLVVAWLLDRGSDDGGLPVDPSTDGALVAAGPT